MKLVKVQGQGGGLENYDEFVSTLQDDGIICFPAENNYRLGASALSLRAVNQLMAAKRRSSHRPALIFVSGPDMLEQVAQEVPPLAHRLAEEFWPGPLTLLVQPSELFPRKIRTILAKATGLIGVRIPGHPVARGIVQRFGEPVLVSSANLTRRSGASSPAQVRKNFGRQIELMADSGDLPAEQPSTLVGLAGHEVTIKRPGAVSEADIRRVACAG